MSCPSNCTCNNCLPTYVPTCHTCSACATYSLPVDPTCNTCQPVLWQCDNCATLPLSQLSNPCYDAVGPCTEGCEESLKTNCILINGNQLGGLFIESGVALEVALKNADYRFQELANAINTIAAGSIVSYSYKSTCPLVTISSLKKNGVETVSMPITTNRSGILGILQGADPLWTMTSTHFSIMGTDVWELVLSCN